MLCLLICLRRLISLQFQWSAPSSTWQQVGQVVDAIGQGRKQLYEGKEYDYVFDVDVSEGVPPLKLPYNVAGRPPSFYTLFKQEWFADLDF